ncbi:MAG: vWA domain-containing protein, partial [Bdellovibrionia bacterium]
MKFAASQWLWALLLIPVFYGILRGDESRKKKRFEQFAHPKLWSFLVPEMNPALRTRKVIFGLLAFGFAIFALARPQYGFHQESVKLTGLDVMVVLDVSRSMDVEDVVPSRLKKAKHLIKKILDRLDGDRVGLVGFAGSSFLACPLTTDLAYVWDRVEILTPQSVTPQGTDLGAGLSAAIGALERGAEQGKGATAEAKTSRVLLLLSDGEDHQGRLREWADQLKDSGISLFVVGVGTDAGAPIPIQDENGNRVGYKKDRNSQPVMSQFHPEALRDLAQRVGGRYWTITPQESEAEEILHELSGLVRGEFSERKIAVYEERFQIPLFFAVLFLLLELCVPARKLLVWVAVFFHGLSSLQAAEMKPLPGSLDSYLSNQKGIDAFEK